MSSHAEPDPPIDEIRAVRHDISARFGHDPRKLFEHYIHLQKRHADRLMAVAEDRDIVEELPAPNR